MRWGGGWGNHVPDTARTVAKAFYEGRRCRRGNCRTDGFAYYLEETAIAVRRPPEVIAANVAAMLLSETGTIKLSCVPLEFTFGGWPTKMTARHLSALGIDAEVIGVKNPECYLDGKPCSSGVWYTPEQIKALPPKPPPPPKPLKPPHLRKFINLTPDLFTGLCES